MWLPCTCTQLTQVCTDAHTNTQALSHTPQYTHTHAHKIHTHTCIHNTLAHPLTRTHSYTLTQTHTTALTHKTSHTLSLVYSRASTLPPTHARTHTHILTCTPAGAQEPGWELAVTAAPVTFSRTCSLCALLAWRHLKSLSSDTFHQPLPLKLLLFPGRLLSRGHKDTRPGSLENAPVERRGRRQQAGVTTGQEKISVYQFRCALPPFNSSSNTW